MRSAKFFLPVLLLFLFSELSQATPINGGRGLRYTKAAYTTRLNHLWAMGQMRFWGKTAEFNNEMLGIQSGSTIWVVQGLTSFSYGLSKNAAFAFTPVLYQDTHQDNGSDILWDSFLDLRFGNYKIQDAPLWVGFNIGTRLPTGSHHNIIFEDYTAGRFEWGLTGMMSYRYLSPNLKYDYRFHLNIGYWNHNDSGQLLTDDPNDPDALVDKNSQSFRYAAGFEFPTMIFDYGLELYGLAWIQAPPPAAYSRENYLYMNVSLGYKPHPRFHFFVNGDFRLSNENDASEDADPAFSSLPNYPDWRVSLGIKYLILPNSVYQMHKQTLREQEKENSRKLMSQLQKEKAKAAKTRQELEKLRAKKENQQREKSDIVMEKNQDSGSSNQ